MADRQRQCVALSRARDGLVIVSNQGMAGRNTSQGFLAWERLVDHHRTKGHLLVVDGADKLLWDRLGIPNDTADVEVGRV